MNFEVSPASNLSRQESLISVVTGSLAIGVLAALLLAYGLVLDPVKPRGRLLIAPMIGQLEGCYSGKRIQSTLADDPAYIQCLSEPGSAAPVVEATLAAMGPRISRNGRYEMGYTLNVPLLNLFEQTDTPNGNDWVINDRALERMVRTIAQADRHLVLYLFSTHFSAFAPIEQALAADPANIGVTPDGPLSGDKHYGMHVYPWTLARTDNSLSLRRVQALNALISKLCDQPVEVRDRVSAITLLGETHHLFPGFEGGMGFAGQYRVTDYSSASVSGFRAFLRSRFGSIGALNEALGDADYRSFDDVHPPSIDDGGETLRRAFKHLDAYSTGYFPVQGWLVPDQRLSGIVEIRLNGHHLGFAKTRLARRELLEQIPGLQTPDIAWRFDLDFRGLPPGSYEVTAVAGMRGGQGLLLGRRRIDIGQVGQRQVPVSAAKFEFRSPHAMDHFAVPPKDLGVRAGFEMPEEGMRFFFNPLAVQWQDFRNRQVLDYLHFMEQPLIDSCMSSTPRFTHQLFPYPNPSWAHDKYAVDASLRASGRLHLGISLYGEASYGDSFFEWKLQSHRGDYGVTEFHPLRGMDSTEFEATLARHRNSGARFISFFTEARGVRPSGVINKGSTIPYFSPGNPQYNSDRLYRSLQVMMATP